MITRKILPLILIVGTAAQAATLPIKPGTYVLAGIPCSDPPFAATFAYDGSQFSYPHASHCRSVVRAHAGRSYRVRETCSALGDGTAATPDTIATTYTIVSPELVRVTRGGTKDSAAYRRCPSPTARKRS